MDRLVEDVVKNRLLWKAGELFRVDDRFLEPFLSDLLESVKCIIISPGYEITVNDQNVAEMCLARSIMIIRSGKDNQRFEKKFVEILCCCLKFPLCSIDSLMTPHAKIATDILSYFYLTYSTLPLVNEFLSTTTKFLLCGNPAIIENLTCFFLLIVESSVRQFSKHIEILLQSILQCDNYALMPILLHLHSMDDHKHITMNLNQLLSSSCKSGSDAVREASIRLVALMYRDQPQVVEDCLRRIIDFLGHPPVVRATINILNEIFWSNQKIFYFYVTGIMQIGLAASAQDFDLIGSLLVSVCSTDETLAKDCLVYLTACLFHKTSNVAIIFAWIESLLPKYLCHLPMMGEVVLHLENESEVSEFSLSIISRLKAIVSESFERNSSEIPATPVASKKSTSTMTDIGVKTDGGVGRMQGSSGQSTTVMTMTRRVASDESGHFDVDRLTSSPVEVCVVANDPGLVGELHGGNYESVEAVEKPNQPHLTEDAHKIKPENLIVTTTEQYTEQMLSVMDENQNYFKDLKIPSRETNEVKSHSDASSGVDQGKRDFETKTNDQVGQPEQSQSRCIESSEASGSGFFENVGYQSSQASVCDETFEDQSPKTPVESRRPEQIDGFQDEEEEEEYSGNRKSDPPSTSACLSAGEGSSPVIWKDDRWNGDVGSSKECLDASIRTSLMLLESRCSKSSLSPDALEIYCDTHRKETLDSLNNLLLRAPLPVDVLVSRADKNKPTFVLEFRCPSADERCAFGRSSGFCLDSKHVATWLHVMFLAATVDDCDCDNNGGRCRPDDDEDDDGDLSRGGQGSLEGDLLAPSSSSPAAACCPKHQRKLRLKKKIVHVWSSILSQEKSFIKTIISGFPDEKKIQKALKELQERRCFDLFSRTERSAEWLCFVCRNASHGPPFVRSDGSLNVDSVLKKKSGYLKFLKPWKFTRFLVDGFRLSYVRNEQPITLEEITKVKAKEHHGPLLPRYTTVSLTATRGASTPPSSAVDGSDGGGSRKKKLTLRFFDQSEAKVWIRCLCVLVARFQNTSGNLEACLGSE